MFTSCFDFDKLTQRQQNQFCLAKTDGVSVSLVFRRPIADDANRLQQIKDDFNNGRFDNFVAVDAGSIYPIVYTRVEPMHGFRETQGYLSNKRYHAMQKSEYHNREINKASKKYLDLSKNLMAACKSVFGQNLEYHLYTSHRMLMYNLGMSERVVPKSIALRKFEFYGRKQSIAQRIANDIAGTGNTLCALAPNTPIRQNSPIKGYLRAPLKYIDHAIRTHDRIKVVDIEEDYTTKVCSYDFATLTINTRISGKRLALCRNCNRTANTILQANRPFRRIKMLSKQTRVAFKNPPRNVNANRSTNRDGDASRCMEYLLYCLMMDQQPDAAFHR